MNELTQERKHVYVSNVGKPSLIQVAFSDMYELTLERNPMCVSTGESPSLFLLLFEYMREFTLSRRLMYVKHVVKPSFLLVAVGNMQYSQWEESLTFVCGRRHYHDLSHNPENALLGNHIHTIYVNASSHVISFPRCTGT
jgi:hypothetical protein